MQSACKVIDNARMMHVKKCKEMKNGCGVNDTASTMHVVSLTSMNGACSVIDTACMMHMLSLTPHAVTLKKYDIAQAQAQATNDLSGPGSL
jgi:hypothetical protein